MTIPLHNNQLGLQRALALSDGIFAIAITLAVFQITPTDLPARIARDGSAQVLQHLLPQLIDLLISFAVVGLYWISHHRIFSHIREADTTVLRLNLLFLASISLVPFTTQFQNAPASDNVAVMLYAGNMAFTGFSLALLWWNLSRKPALLVEHSTPRFIRVNMIRTLIAPSLFLVSMLIAVFNPLVAKIFWLMIALSSRITNKITAS